MNYYVLETLIRERMEEVERRSRLAWMFEVARAEGNDSSRAVSDRRPFRHQPVGQLFRDVLTRRYA